MNVSVVSIHNYMHYESCPAPIKISIIGAGAWGLALSSNWLADQKSNKSLINDFVQPEIDLQLICRNHAGLVKYNENLAKYNESISTAKILNSNTNLKVSANLLDALASDIIIWAVPVQHSMDYLNQCSALFEFNGPIIVASKGIELNYQLPLFQIFKNLFKNAQVGVLSGPNFANEISGKKISGTTLGFESLDYAKFLAQKLKTKNLRIYAHNDPLGMSYWGALKNVMAIAAGVVKAKNQTSDKTNDKAKDKAKDKATNFGLNTHYLLLTRASAEINRLVLALGGMSSTQSTLAGTGDLYLTASSLESRNTKFGYELVRQNECAVDELLQLSKGVVEGVPTAKAAYLIGTQHKIRLPIINTIYKILWEKSDLDRNVDNLINNQAVYEVD